MGGPGSDALLGGAGDDVYQVGPGDIAAGVIELIDDREGNNTLSLMGGVINAYAQGSDMIVVFDAERGLAITEGFAGAVAQIESAAGTQSMAAWAQDNVRSPVNVTAQAGSALVFGGAANDVLGVATGVAAQLYGGRGNDSYNLVSAGAGGAVVRVELGDGQDSVQGTVRNGAPRRLENVLSMGKNVLPASVHLVATR